jgi:AGZA family xanthine/uracil permease-like MFS transporter
MILNYYHLQYKGTEIDDKNQYQPPSSLLEKIFKFSAHKTNIKTELMVGVTIFVTMSYIMFLNPNIMSKTGIPFDGLCLATYLGAAITTILMGLYANWSVRLGVHRSLIMQAFKRVGVLV